MLSLPAPTPPQIRPRFPEDPLIPRWGAKTPFCKGLVASTLVASTRCRRKALMPGPGFSTGQPRPWRPVYRSPWCGPRHGGYAGYPAHPGRPEDPEHSVTTHRRRRCGGDWSNSGQWRGFLEEDLVQPVPRGQAPRRRRGQGAAGGAPSGGEGSQRDPGGRG